MVKIGTDLSPADLLTKPLPFKRIQELGTRVGVEPEQNSTTDGMLQRRVTEDWSPRARCGARVCSEGACSM